MQRLGSLSDSIPHPGRVQDVPPSMSFVVHELGHPQKALYLFGPDSNSMPKVVIRSKQLRKQAMANFLCMRLCQSARRQSSWRCTRRRSSCNCRL
eukprot:6479347-Amphidinium_carterae.2